MMLDSVEVISLSVYPNCVLMEEYITINKVFGLVDLSIEWSETCCILLWFVDNWLVKRVAHLMRVQHWWLCIHSERRYTIPRQILMLLKYNCNYVSCILFSWIVFSKPLELDNLDFLGPGYLGHTRGSPG